MIAMHPRRFVSQSLVVLLVLAAASRSAQAQSAIAENATEAKAEIPLYPGVAPGSEKWDWKERTIVTTTGMPITHDVVRPVLLHFPADPSKAVGTAMIVAPGGGFRALMMSYEGVDVAGRLNAMGVDAFVLKYRLMYTGPGAPRPAASSKLGERPRRYTLTGEYEGQTGQELVAIAGEDGKQAVKIVRERAEEFHLRGGRIGMIGYSAGGVVTTDALFGPVETRPNFAALIYGVGEIKEVPNPAPPLFLAVAADDPIAVDRSVEVFSTYLKGKGPTELHIFQMGAHGFVTKGGGADHYLDRLEEWLKANKLLTKPAE